ncbi:uncharacterized protein LOC107009480 [Solanum pennellii]|uniref:Uncharacterized protein LOC107009480 n=1 Tax=Solanum pennellii TaxID=28526 RepID=A0ABM1G0S3_SOLPN|nr:uncharacterized protein LOC107009480 [Solanum pennellii]
MDTNPNDFASISNYISPMKGLEARVDHVKSECSSRRVSSNKENNNPDKAEMPKLSVEPLHMKRKKRSGGCNLRKSLAWDRAFSTEEGVLDPLELSLLSGSLVKTRGETLFTINEEERNPTSNDSLHDASSVYLSSNKKSTVKGIRAVALKEESRKASTKIPASHNGRTISKSSSCSRPLSSASLKRPANMNFTPSFIENKGSAGSGFRDSELPQASYNSESLVLHRLEDGNPNEAEESDISSVIDGLICNSKYGNMIHLSGEVMKEGFMGGCNNLTGGEFEKVKSFAVEDDGIFDNDKYIMKIKSNLSKVQRELMNIGGGNCEPLNLTDSNFSEVKIEMLEVAYQHEDSHNLKEAFTCKQITDRAQTGGLVADISSVTLSGENCETDPDGLSIYSEHKFQAGSVLHSSGQSLSKHVCIDQSQDGQIDETGFSGLPYRSDESVFDRFDVTSVQTVVGEDPAEIMCPSPVKITLPSNCNHSTDEEVNPDKILASSTTCLEFGSSSSRTREKMVSDVPGSIGECRKPIIESVLEVVDETEIHNSLNCHNDGNLTSSMEFGSSSRGTQNVIGSGKLGPVGEGNKSINGVLLSKGMNELEIQDSSIKLNDGNETITLKLVK